MANLSGETLALNAGISGRTSFSFERYNEGRRLWSGIVYASRGFARLTWLIPDIKAPTTKEIAADLTRDEIEEKKALPEIEKIEVINLIEAFAVAVKHYLRGEYGIYHSDLYPLVRGLPPYTPPEENTTPPRHTASGLPLPSTTSRHAPMSRNRRDEMDEPCLYPGRNPPRHSIFDAFPFSLLTKHRRRLEEEKAHRLRTLYHANGNGQEGDAIVSYNVPLQITLYLGSYISALLSRGAIDTATATQMFTALNTLVDSLTGLERILTTPIPFSYSVHLWIIAWLYCLALPFQILTPLGWITIPATVLASLVFFGFLVAGEEIESPFGYESNHLDIDLFTSGIIRLDLQALVSVPIPDPAVWAFDCYKSRLESRLARTVSRGPANKRLFV